jgi:hypothetical protein
MLFCMWRVWSCENKENKIRRKSEVLNICPICNYPTDKNECWGCGEGGQGKYYKTIPLTIEHVLAAEEDARRLRFTYNTDKILKK